jgi:hypothetical protein
MNTTGLVKYAAALVAIAICSACGTPAVAPSTAAFNVRYVGRTLYLNGRPVTAARVNLNPLPRYAMTVPDPNATSRKKFEYVINFYGSYASIFDYPKSHKQIGTIDNVGGQGCTNVLYGYGKGIFWIVAGQNQITEYQVPQKAIKMLSAPAGSMPSSCAMDAGGDLAVGILTGTDQGDVVIYKNARGSGTVYTTPFAGGEYFDGYDNHGNLFADGFTHIGKGSLSADGFTRVRWGFALVELRKGGTKFHLITTSNTIGFPGSVQWDGKYLAILDQNGNNIYQYAVSGTKATLKGTVSLNGAGDCAQTWLATGIVYCGDTSNGDGEVFKYPAGGSAIADLTGTFDFPLGVVAAAK